MKMQNRIEMINDLYLSWLNERDPFTQREKQDEIKSKISPYEFLIYSIRQYPPYDTFRKIFSLEDLFITLEQMEEQGIDIKDLTRQPLVIEDIEDMQALDRITKRESSPQIRKFRLKFQGNNVFKYGDIKGIGEKFPHVCVNFLDLEVVEQMLNEPGDYKGIPIVITIDNIGQLPLEKLDKIEQLFDVGGVRVVENDRRYIAHQGEQKPLNLKTYKKIRKVVDDEIISKLYISDNTDRLHEDYQLALQIIDKVNDRLEYDEEAVDKEHFSKEMANSSGLVGLLTGKSNFKGYSEIVRNILSCVDMESRVVDGIAFVNKKGVAKQEEYSWNQIKLGDSWFNTDVVAARDKISKGEPSGNLFMSDKSFFGWPKRATFEKGKEQDGMSLECTVLVGGHTKTNRLNDKKCDKYCPPFLTAYLIQSSRTYDERYKNEGKSPDYKGPIPYVGSSIQKRRSSARQINELQYE